MVEPSDYVLRNAGDMAMLEVAVTRLATMWPERRICVLSDTPDVFPRYRENVEPIAADGRRAWLNGASDGVAADFIRLVETADLLVVAGMGGITDAFPDYAMGVLATLELAIRSGVPTAMMGQGIGPLEGAQLRERAASVLPRVDRIALREQRAGRPILLQLGVPANRIATTGDDAIQTAFDRRPQRIGTGVGINLRAASYSGIDRAQTERIEQGLRRWAAGKDVSFVPVPISRVPGEEDALTIRAILSQLDPDSSGGMAISNAAGVVEQTLKCRVVLTGSYHAGVFALSVGVPVVAIASSRYYVDKFLGLAEQFPSGCATIFFDDADLPARLAAAMEDAWHTADLRRDQLLAAAAAQVDASRAAYSELQTIVRNR